MTDGFKELKCEPKKQGPNKQQTAQRFNLTKNHINLEQAGRGNANGIRLLMEELEKQFMEDPDNIVDDSGLGTTMQGSFNATQGNLGDTMKGGTTNASFRGSPMRGSQPGGPNAGTDKSKKAGNTKKHDADDVDQEKTTRKQDNSPVEYE